MQRALFAMSIAASAGLAAAQDPPGFTLAPGFPFEWDEPSWNGGMFVNTDADADLEFVGAARSRLYSIDLDTASPAAGWPRIVGDSTFSAPAWGDINGDGQEEIVYHTFFFGIDSSLWAFETDGSTVPGFPVVVAGASKSPSLADLDGDGDLEILVNGNSSGDGTIEAYDGDGSMMPGFPFTMFDITAGATPSVADIDNDGRLEIIAMSFSEMWVLEEDGSLDDQFPSPWFPPDVTHGFNSYAPAALVDLDNDGDLEISFHTAIQSQNPSAINSAPTVHILHHDGTSFTGWPQDLPIPNIDQAGGGATTMYAPLSIADIDADGSYDIVTGDVTLCPDDCTVVMAWDQSGAAKPGFPITGVTATQNQITIADIDGDGTMELFKDNNRAANPPEAFNHDGTPLVGWEFANVDGSGQMEFGDVDNDGFMDFMLPASNITTAVQKVRFRLYTSETVPYSPEAAPVGTFMYNYQRTGVVPSIFEPCVADTNGDGQLTPSDFNAWIIAFNTQSPACDQNGDGLCTPADFNSWILNYNNGCP